MATTKRYTNNSLILEYPSGVIIERTREDLVSALQTKKDFIASEELACLPIENDIREIDSI
jgi:hypothetical protein